MSECFLAYCIVDADRKTTHHISELTHELRMHSRSIHDLRLVCFGIYAFYNAGFYLQGKHEAVS